jgi:hypothetical protein
MYSASAVMITTVCTDFVQVANMVAGSFVLAFSTVLDTLARTLSLGVASGEISGYVKLMIAILKFLDDGR